MESHVRVVGPHDITDPRLQMLQQVRYTGRDGRRAIDWYLVDITGWQAIAVQERSDGPVVVFAARPGGLSDVGCGANHYGNATTTAHYIMYDLVDDLLGVRTAWGPPEFRKPWQQRHRQALEYFEPRLPKLADQEVAPVATKRTKRTVERQARNDATEHLLERVQQQSILEHGYVVVPAVAAPPLAVYLKMFVAGRDDAWLVGCYRIITNPVGLNVLDFANDPGVKLEFTEAMTVVERGVCKVAIFDGERIWWGKLNVLPPRDPLNPGPRYHDDLRVAFSEWRYRSRGWPFDTVKQWTAREQALLEVPDPVPQSRDLVIGGEYIPAVVTHFDITRLPSLDDIPF